jgi:hypothetical protein
LSILGNRTRRARDETRGESGENEVITLVAAIYAGRAEKLVDRRLSM